MKKCQACKTRDATFYAAAKTWPYNYSFGEYESKEFALCDDCKKLFDKKIDDVVNFIRKEKQ